MQKNDLYLKIHMYNGAVYVLSQWTVDSVTHSIMGQGKLLDAYRQELEEGTFTVDIDSVAIFETNKVRPSAIIAPMAIITGISVSVTAYCIANPKACFGSCPTIYTHDGDYEVLQAEGFSASIAPSLEATDIDALHIRVPNEQKVHLQVKNEALETHVIRSLDLLAVPRRPTSRIFLGIDGNFYQTQAPLQPKSCLTGAEVISMALNVSAQPIRQTSQRKRRLISGLSAKIVTVLGWSSVAGNRFCQHIWSIRVWGFLALRPGTGLLNWSAAVLQPGIQLGAWGACWAE